MPRFFTLQQAEQLLPEVESAIRDAISLKSEYQQAEEEWHRFSHRITMLGGVLVDLSQVREQKDRRESLAHQLQKALEKIHDDMALTLQTVIGERFKQPSRRGERHLAAIAIEQARTHLLL